MRLPSVVIETKPLDLAVLSAIERRETVSTARPPSRVAERIYSPSLS